MGARTQLHRIAIVPWIEVNEDCGVTFDARTVYASFVPESGRSVLSPQINFMNSGRYLSSHTIEKNYFVLEMEAPEHNFEKFLPH